MMAALLDRKPQFSRLGDMKVPRAWRALKGWRKLCPSRSRLAFPLAVWCALSWRMVAHGHVSKALFNLLQVCTYHRPGSLLRLRKMGLVKPTAGVYMVNGHQPQRDRRMLEGWGQGREHHVGLGLAPVCPSDVCCADSGKTDGLCVGLRLHPVPQGLQHVCGGAGHSSSPLSSTPLRPKHRSCKPRSGLGRGSEARGLVDTPKRDALRESRSLSCHVAEIEASHAGSMQECREIHRGHHARPQLSRHPTSVVKKRKGYFADLFAGTGGVSRAVQKLGFSAREWELVHGENHDLTKPLVQYKLKSDIDRGLVLAAMLAPPCSSFSQARDRTMVIRDRGHPWGLEGLPAHEQEKVKIGNACFRAAVKVIRWLDRYKIPWILENPSTSKCWYLPPIVSLEKANHTFSFVTDFCQFGTRWRKRTKFLVGNLCEDDIARCRRLCQGPPGICSRTHKHHLQLTGSASNGIPWTRIAQPYPKQLCHHLAHALVNKYIVPPP